MRGKLIVAAGVVGTLVAATFIALKTRKQPATDRSSEHATQQPFETVITDYDDMGGQSPAELECVAEKFQGRLFANDERYYRNIETRFGKQTTSQTAWIKNSDLAVEAMAGGCSHYGYSFDFSKVGQDGDSDQEVLDKALAILRELPLSPQGDIGRRSILDPMAKQDFRIRPDGTCNFVETEGYSWAECSIGKKEDGGFTVHLLYTVAL
jgi:hypothetical protein